MVGSTFVKVLENFFRVNGIWINKSNRKLNWILILYFFISIVYNIISSIYLAYLNFGDLELFTEILLHSLNLVIIAFIWFIFLINHKKLSNIYNYAKSKFYVYKTTSHLRDKQKIEKAEKYIIFVIKLFLYFLLISLSIRGMLTLLLHRREKLLFPLWLPFNIDNNLYYIVFAYEFVLYAQFISVAYGLSILYFGFSTFYTTLLSIIGEVFNSVDELIVNKIWYLKQNQQENKLLEDVFRRAIREHENINRSLQDLKPIMASTFLGLSVILEFALCFTVFFAIQKNTVAAFLDALLLSLVLLSTVYMCCWCGNRFSNMNDILCDTVYGCPWYKFPIRHQMSLLTVLRYLTKPINISSVTLAVPSISAFVLFLQTAYSYLNLMLAVSKQEWKEIKWNHSL